MTGTFTAGAVLTAANLNTAINSLTLNAQSGAGYTLVLTDAGKLVTVSNASAQNLTIPLNSSVAYATGTVIEVLNIGAGTWTLTPTGGVTLTGSTSIPTSARVRLTKTGTDTWYANTLGGGGLVFITSSTFSAAATVSVNNCFTSAYANYLIVIDATAAGTNPIDLRVRASSTDDTSANYASQYLTADSTTVSGARETAQTIMRIGYSATTRFTIVTEVFQPAVATPTAFRAVSGQNVTAPYLTQRWGAHNVSTAYDGFTIFQTGGTTITGTLRVYALANS